MINNIDYESLRRDLLDYFGSVTPLFPMAIIDVSYIEQASYSELIYVAINNGFDISCYHIIEKSKKLTRDFE